MDLSITIASYNSCQVTLQALESIRKETRGVDYEIIVVDNASTDNSADMIGKKFPAVRLIRSPRNLGFAAAQNMALAAARGRFLMILNSDVLFVNNPAKQMVDRLLAAERKIGVVGPQILNPDGTVDPSTRRQVIYSRPVVALTILNQSIPFLKLFPVGFAQRHLGRILGGVHDNFSPPDSVQEVAWLNGMCVMFRREVLEESGLFDEQYFFDFEIGDLLLRVAEKGWRIVFDPTAKIIHLGGYSRKRVSRIMIDSQRSELVYYSKFRPHYVPMLRYLNMFRLLYEIGVSQVMRIFSSQAKSCDERIDIYRAAFKLVAEYDPASAFKNVRIPSLAKDAAGERG